MDKATQESIDTLIAMFPNIDRDMVTDIFLGCKKNLDETINQLVSMGAELEKKPTAPPVTPLPEHEKKPTAPPISPQVSTILPSTPPHTPSPVQREIDSEQRRLELIQEQLAQEYKRLADISASNLVLDKQLDVKRESIAAEQHKLEEDKKVLDDQLAAFVQDKKRLEEHLSSRLREMKEQMRRTEEEARLQQEELRTREEFQREERSRQEAMAALEAKEARRAEKLRLKEQRREEKRAMREHEDKEKNTEAAENVAEAERALNRANQLFEDERQELIRKNEELSDQVDSAAKEKKDLMRTNEELTMRITEQDLTLQALREELSKPAPQANVSDVLRGLTSWLDKSAAALQDKPILLSATDFKYELLKSLEENL